MVPEIVPANSVQTDLQDALPIPDSFNHFLASQLGRPIVRFNGGRNGEFPLMAAIQPKILTWARETAGLSLGEAAQALGLKTARGRTGAERLTALETGVEEPPRTLLAKMAKTSRPPLYTLSLHEPPTQADRGHDLRTLPTTQRENPELDALVLA